jgi:hypothetical protein
MTTPADLRIINERNKARARLPELVAAIKGTHRDPSQVAERGRLLNEYAAAVWAANARTGAEMDAMADAIDRAIKRDEERRTREVAELEAKQQAHRDALKPSGVKIEPASLAAILGNIDFRG